MLSIVINRKLLILLSDSRRRLVRNPESQNRITCQRKPKKADCTVQPAFINSFFFLKTPMLTKVRKQKTIRFSPVRGCSRS